MKESSAGQNPQTVVTALDRYYLLWLASIAAGVIGKLAIGLLEASGEIMTAQVGPVEDAPEGRYSQAE